MNNVIVNILPQTAPISDMRNRQSELLEMTGDGPVVLISRSKPAAVLLAPSQWDAIAQELEHYRRSAKPTSLTDKIEPDITTTRKRSKRGDQGSPHPTGSTNQKKAAIQEIDAFAEIAALAQPLGPADLARNFDQYTERVLTVETPQ